MQEDNGIRQLVLLVIRVKKIALLKWKTVLLIGLIGFLLGLVYSAISKPKYTAKFSIILEGDSGGQMGQYLRMAESFGLSLGGGGGSLLTPENIKELAMSKRIVYSNLLKEVSIEGKRKQLVNFYLDWFGVPKSIEKADSLEGYQISATKVFEGKTLDLQILSAIHKRMVKKSLSVDLSTSASFVNISIISKKEKFAYLFSTELLNSLRSYFETNMYEDEKSSITLLEMKNDSVIKILTEKEAQLAALQDQHQYTVKLRANLEKMRLAREVEYLNAMHIASIRNLEMAKYMMQEKKKTFKVLDEVALPLEKNEKSPIFVTIALFVVFSLFGIVFVFLKSEFQAINAELKG